MSTLSLRRGFRLASSTSRRRGAQMLEFALLLPIFVFLIVFTFDMGRLVLTSVALHDTVQQAARSGAQVGGANIGGLNTSNNAFWTAVDVAPGLRADKVSNTSILTGQRCTFTGADRFVTYRAQYRFNFLTPGLYQMVSLATPGDFRLTATSVSRCEVVR